MKTKLMLGGLVVAFLLLGVGVSAGLLGNFLPGQDSSTLPDCGALPAVSQVESAMAEHEALIGQLRAAGEVEVTVDRPCGDQDQAAVLVRCAKPTCKGVEAILASSAGLGVPIRVERR